MLGLYLFILACWFLYLQTAKHIINIQIASGHEESSELASRVPAEGRIGTMGLSISLRG